MPVARVTSAAFSPFSSSNFANISYIINPRLENLGISKNALDNIEYPRYNEDTS